MKRLHFPLVLALGSAAVALGAGLSGCGISTDDLFGDASSGSSGEAAGGGGAASSSSSGGPLVTSASVSSTASGTPASSSASASSGGVGGSSEVGGSGGASTTSSGGGTTTGTGGAPATCGDGAIEPPEQCDGQDLGGATCRDLGYATAAGLACTAACQLDASGCAAHCHNGVKEPGEVCDGNDLGGKSCTDYGYVNAAGLACANCQGFDSSGCRAHCGNGVREPGEDCDAGDLGGVTCQMFGFVNPGGLRCDDGCNYDPSSCQPICGNGVVEPGEQCDDGNTTNGDGCSSTCQGEGTTCAAATAIAVDLGTVTFDGTTVGGGQHKASSATPTCPTGGPDRVYALTAQADGFLTASLTRAMTAFDSTLYISTSCADATPVTPLICADSKDPQGNQELFGGEVVSLRVTPGQTYYLFVDGGTESGAYHLVVNFAAGTNCNDPILFPIEAGTPMLALGSTPNTTFTGSGSCGGDPGPDVVYALTPSATEGFKLLLDATRTNYNSVLYARRSCGDGNTEIACSNVSGTSGETISLPNLAAGQPTYVWVDGSTIGGGQPQGNYGLVVTPQ